MATLWTKGGKADSKVEEFTVGQDRVLDLRLALYDVKGSKAHIAMLAKVGLLDIEEEKTLQQALDEISESISEGKFRLDDDVEDIHSQVEINLTRKLGDSGRKIHSGRSRNDQVLVDIKLFLKDECLRIRDEVLNLFNLLISLSRKYRQVLLPGYTHFQIAMPSSFGLWLGGYAESLADDMLMLGSAYGICNQNPLGSAAGYGSSFPLDRRMTTRLLGFNTLVYNSVACQLGRGKTEKAVAAAIGQIATTLNHLAQDCCLYMSQNFGFISFPKNLTTGSSIMPHKKNPDVWEMIRGNCNLINSAYSQISLITSNLPHGYHRDYQLLKDVLFPALDRLHNCLEMTVYMMENLQVRKDILKESIYKPVFTVEKVNRLVEGGMPFRNAYKSVGQDVENGSFRIEGKLPEKAEDLHHTHLGSIGNLALNEIKKKMRLASRW